MINVVMLAKVLLAGALMVYVAQQCRRPSSGLGRMLARSMNANHDRLTHWGLSHVEVEPGFTMLDVGCGGGRTIETLAAMAAEGQAFGVDYSPASVAVARERNHASIEAGRVHIREGTVSSLPFPDATFDLVTAVETHYYWPDLAADVREVLRVLKPGGTVAIIAETYRGRKNDWLYRPVMRLVLRAAYLTPEQHRRLLSDAGYSGVEVFEEKSRGWICATGHRPDGAL
jgi:ubiquinone/menaquinone biosynthesis C-methylase UbiE